MNPEFQRYAWLELTPHRLVVAPLLLLAFFALLYLANSGDFLWPLTVSAYWVAMGLGVLWGARNASESVVSEVREGTWDQQRLSSVGPWAMTWGKLFGAPVFVWYTSVPALMLFVAGASERVGVVEVIVHFLLLIAIVVFAHAVGLLVSLLQVARNTLVAARSVAGLHIIGLIAGMFLVGPAFMAFINGWGEPVRWFAMQFSQQSFACFTVGSLVLWSVVGCYRLMRAELQMRNAPWVWIAFVLYCMTYVAGHVWADDALRQMGRLFADDPWVSAPLSAYFVALALAAAMLFIEPKDPVEFRRLLFSFRERHWTAFSQAIPRWLCAWLVGVVVMCGLLFSDSIGAVFCASTMAFFMRDAGIVVLLNLGANRSRSDAAAMLYLLVLYGLLPGILNAVGSSQLDGWLYPSPAKGLLAAIAPALVQAALVWWLARNRWRQLWTAVDYPSAA